MPFINSKVNTSLTEDEKERLKTRLGQAITLIPGKSESWLMVGFEEKCSLYFKGKNDGRLAFVEVKIFGKANDSSYDKLTAALCRIYQEILQIEPDHVYITYEEVEHWGWNGSNF